MTDLKALERAFRGMSDCDVEMGRTLYAAILAVLDLKPEDVVLDIVNLSKDALIQQLGGNHMLSARDRQVNTVPSNAPIKYHLNFQFVPGKVDSWSLSLGNTIILTVGASYVEDIVYRHRSTGAEVCVILRSLQAGAWSVPRAVAILRHTNAVESTTIPPVQNIDITNRRRSHKNPIAMLVSNIFGILNMHPEESPPGNDDEEDDTYNVPRNSKRPRSE